MEEGGSVRPTGKDRGSVGQKMIAEPVKQTFSFDNAEERMVESALASCSAEDDQGVCSSDEVIDGLFSGTILRDCVKALKCNVEYKESERPLDYFVLVF